VGLVKIGDRRTVVVQHVELSGFVPPVACFVVVRDNPSRVVSDQCADPVGRNFGPGMRRAATRSSTYG
jgi:hypothetical protein